MWFKTTCSLWLLASLMLLFSPSRGRAGQTTLGPDGEGQEPKGSLRELKLQLAERTRQLSDLQRQRKLRTHVLLEMRPDWKRKLDDAGKKETADAVWLDCGVKNARLMATALGKDPGKDPKVKEAEEKRKLAWEAVHIEKAKLLTELLAELATSDQAIAEMNAAVAKLEQQVAELSRGITDLKADLLKRNSVEIEKSRKVLKELETEMWGKLVHAAKGHPKRQEIERRMGEGEFRITENNLGMGTEELTRRIMEGWTVILLEYVGRSQEFVELDAKIKNLQHEIRDLSGED